MSYDLMVFDVEAAPTDRDGFMRWYDQQTAWNESHDYNNPEVTALRLRSWFLDIIKQFPPMNGPLAAEDPEDSKVSDYCIGRSVIYVGFAWSETKAAYQTMLSLARRHGVGFFDVSSTTGEVWGPGPDGSYECFFRANRP